MTPHSGRMLIIQRMSRRRPVKIVSPALGAWVKQIRQAKGLKQLDLTDATGMQNSAISRLERGANMEIDAYERYARGLGYRNALEMFRAGSDRSTRRLLRLWALLDDDAAREEVLELVKARIAAEPE